MKIEYAINYLNLCPEKNWLKIFPSKAEALKEMKAYANAMFNDFPDWLIINSQSHSVELQAKLNKGARTGDSLEYIIQYYKPGMYQLHSCGDYIQYHDFTLFSNDVETYELIEDIHHQNFIV